MRFFHLSDLHIGKQLHSYSLKDNQQAVLAQIEERAKELCPDAILICGDIFDRAVPSGEAYTIFDTFLQELAAITPNIPVLVIAGNHDNAQRLSYASSFLKKHQIYVSTSVSEEPLQKIVLKDEFGEVDFYLMPFVKPGYVRHLFEEGAVTDYQSAVQEILKREQIDESRRNVLLSHQFYTNSGQAPELCDSEQSVLTIGGLDNVDVSVVEQFDYVALGHIHGAQMVKFPYIRYCGTPLKYSVSEEHHKKSITMVTMGAKGTKPVIDTIPLVPIQEVRRERGLLREVIARADRDHCHDFLSVTLIDEKQPYHPKEQLEEVYDHILELRIDNERTRSLFCEQEEMEISMHPLDVFRSFYQEMQGQPLTPEEEALLGGILERWEGEGA